MAAMALVMAGGHGLRMRASGIVLPKPLVPVLAVPLLERNIHALLRHDITNIAIALPRGAGELEEHVAARIEPLTKAVGAILEIFVEDRPLGNIGCAGSWKDRTDSLLVVYADNLTTLNLSLLLSAHENSGADLTMATHLQPFHMPFGEVHVENGEVRAYLEKPVHSFPVCSAVSVLGRRALNALPDDRPTGLSNLAQSLIDSGGRVRAFAHSAPWIDVNDAFAVKEAENLVGGNHREFDLWARYPAVHAAALLAASDGSVLLVPPSHEGGQWSLPNLGEPVADIGEVGEASTLLSPFTGGVEPPEPAWISFDDLDGTGSRTCRFHVCLAAPAAARGYRHASWRPLAGITVDPDVTSAARRAVALAAFRQKEQP